MLIKFINRGTGSGKSAKEYLLQQKDHKGEVRAGVKVLRGNPQAVTDVIDSLDFKHKYRSAVIAWHKDDNPTDKEIAQVLEDFERVSFAGLEANQYCYYAVQHEDSDGSKHVHIVVPRVELQSGLSMNIAPPNWQKTYDVLRDKHNVKNEWASPADLERRQSLTLDKSMIHGKLKQNEAKQLINQFVNDAISHELVKDREEMVAYLSEIGEVTRQGKDYLSVKPNGFKKAIKLKGAIYEREFDIEKFDRKIEREKEERVGGGAGNRARKLDRVSSVLENIIEERAKFNKKRFQKEPRELPANRGNDENRDIKSKPKPPRLHQRHDQRPREEVGEAKRRESQLHLALDTLFFSVDSNRSVRDDMVKRSQTWRRSEAGVGQRIPAKKLPNREHLGRFYLTHQGALGYDTIRSRIERSLANARADVQRTTGKYRERLQVSDERSLASYRTAEQSVGDVRKRIEEHSDNHRQRASEVLAGEPRELEQSTEQLAKARRRLITTIKQHLSTIIEKIRTSAQELSQDWGINR